MLCVFAQHKPVKSSCLNKYGCDVWDLVKFSFPKLTLKDEKWWEYNEDKMKHTTCVYRSFCAAQRVQSQWAKIKGGTQIHFMDVILFLTSIFIAQWNVLDSPILIWSYLSICLSFFLFSFCWQFESLIRYVLLIKLDILWAPFFYLLASLRQ